MSTSEKKRIAKEADYLKNNSNTKSVCCGVFYNKSKKTYEPCKNCTKCFKFKEYNTVKEERPQVQFHYIDSFRKCEFYKVKPIDAVYLMTAITYNMLYVNDMACNYVKDLEKSINKSGDKELKKKFGAAIKRVNRYFSMINGIVGKNLDFFAEYNSGMDDIVDDSADNMLNRIEEIFNELAIPNAKMLSKIEMARTIVGLSVTSINIMVHEGRRLNEQIESLYTYKLTELRDIMEDLTNWSFRHIRNGFNMNNDEKLQKCFQTLRERLMNHENVCNSLTNAEELYGRNV